MNRPISLLWLALWAGLALGGSACSSGKDPSAEKAQAKSSPPAAVPHGDSAVVALCSAHGVPASLCYLCDPSRRDPERLWCAEHARYEDRCWLCHPELRDAARLYCEEHSLYEDECFYCHPELAKPGGTAPADARSEHMPAEEGLICPEHGVPESECGICHPELADRLEPGQGLMVRFPSGEAAGLAGVRTAHPRVGTAAEAVETFAEITFDQNALAQIVAPVAGILQSVEVDLGQRVVRGTTLAHLASGVLGEAASRAILARQTVERERELRAGRVSSERELQEAEAAHQSAQQELHSLGYDDADIAALGSDPSLTAVLPLRAPFAGEIVERSAVRGALVEAGTPLFSLADPTTMWAMLSIPERQIAGIRVGQQVEIQLDSLPGETFTGTLTWVAAQVDEHTRLARARAEIPNSDRRLRARSFARARILTSDPRGGTLVPTSAVQRVNDRPFVFLKVAEDLYEARRVDLGAAQNGTLLVRSGVLPADDVVVDGSYFVKSQLLLSRLGAGCVD